MDQKEAIEFLHILQNTINAQVSIQEPFRISIDIADGGLRVRFPFGPGYYLNARTPQEKFQGLLCFSGKTLEGAVISMVKQIFSDGKMVGIHFHGRKKYAACRPRVEKIWDFKVAITYDDQLNIVTTGESKEIPLQYETTE